MISHPHKTRTETGKTAWLSGWGRDFESRASASSAIPAGKTIANIITVFLKSNRRLPKHSHPQYLTFNDSSTRTKPAQFQTRKYGNDCIAQPGGEEG